MSLRMGALVSWMKPGLSGRVPASPTKGSSGYCVDSAKICDPVPLEAL